ncbi:WD40 repeat domain-containing protein [Microlunatus flavus]|uniref:WD40-like Beta Propeller Repeat n=1 Tax=Microlunatus flavus TaxID=1036181 RepID=A0A1H9KCU3_9ACTN|nr:hypothetical protein [Microlunatus flavus]SEQ97026.1 hypothetical protein SAMN05421756_107160 [Microlunatus flavus]
MARWCRTTLALLLALVGVAALGPSPAAVAAPAPPSVGLGTVIADLGVTSGSSGAAFSPGGAYYVYRVPMGERCELRLYDVGARRSVDMPHDQVGCYLGEVAWAAETATLTWLVEDADGTGTAYVWDPRAGAQVAVPDGVTGGLSLSADGRFLAFTGRASGAPGSGGGWRILDRSTGVSRTLTAPGVDVDFKEWSPTGHRFVADTSPVGSGSPNGTCFGETSCDVLSTYTYFGNQSGGGQWSPDGTAVLGFDQVAFDFSDRSFTPFPRGLGFSGDAVFLDEDRVAGSLDGDDFIWNRRSGEVVRLPSIGTPSPNGRYLLLGGATRESYRYRNVLTGATAPATYRGDTRDHDQLGYWTDDGAGFLGLGPGGCSSLRQWSPASNTVSLFVSPGPRTCFEVPYPRAADTWKSAFRTFSSRSGRFALIMKTSPGSLHRDFVVDLRRHVLLGPLDGEAQAFAPSGSDVLSVAEQPGGGTTRMFLVDPAPVPDVDDKPRWSAASPANGTRVQAAVGERVHVRVGASDLQGTPVNLYFRWRDSAGVPIKSAPKGWSCDRRRLAAGATVADCTFAPPHDHTATRYLDVWAVNHDTGAQSDTRAYRVAVGR